MIPINGWMANKSQIYNEQQMTVKDSRSKIMDEFLSGMKVIKLYAWEPPFLKKIRNIRKNELNIQKRVAYLTAFQT